MLQLGTKFTTVTGPAAGGVAKRPRPLLVSGLATAPKHIWQRGPEPPSLRTSTALHSSPNWCQGEERAGHLPQLCLVKGSTPQATEKTHGVWIPTRLTGKSGALLLSLVKLKQRWKHLAEGCGCFQMERQLWRQAVKVPVLDWGICSFTEPPSGTDGRGVLEKT